MAPERRMTLLDPHALECLAALMEERGFERAAARLSITQSAVSQRLKALESQVGAVLIVRSRPLRPTTAGRLLLRHAMQLRLLRADLAHDLRELTPSASTAHEEERMSIAVNADSIATWVLPAVTTMVTDGLPLEIIADDQDFTHEWLREGQVLGCVTALGKPLRGCQITALGEMPYVAVASPSYAAAHCPDGLTISRFRSAAFIAFNRKDDLQARFVRQAMGLRTVDIHQRFVPSAEGRLRAVLAGWGVSVLPELQVRELLQQGGLVNVSPGSVLPVELFWHCWNIDSPMLTALTEAITGAARRALNQPLPDGRQTPPSADSES